LPADLSITNALSIHREGVYAAAIVRDWTDQLHTELETQTGAEIEVEGLTLEDIFLELHR
jgi:hypothetical protein